METAVNNRSYSSWRSFTTFLFFDIARELREVALLGFI